MAIKPEELPVLDAKNLRAVERAEKKIDSALKGGSLNREEAYITVGRLNQREQSELVRRYNEAGWKLVLHWNAYWTKLHVYLKGRYL